MKPQHRNRSVLTRGLRLQVQSDGELVTVGTVDSLEDVDLGFYAGFN